ncbi:MULTISPECIES: hypothetical protein [Halomonadaceae]|uniref:Uncharacterized protein n=1 Tax=Vreelandella halophila TaxID=86177 RepID=A0A9X4YEC9_9GAMM|nr:MULTISPECIES: hypothetical protein [Halomonas]MYL28146.1 hypothetical protein [Halomonas utahensis]MYL76053.1 hypothetical protein [Halomonas sp. 22501_18_FS]
MGLFDALRSFEHEINEVRKYLISDKRMQKKYANPFIAAYGRKIGQLIARGRKRTSHLDTSHERGSAYNQEFADNDIRFSVLGQAITAYLQDLRAGRYVNTAVETAVWGILLDEDPALIDSMKPGLSSFIKENYKRKAPDANNVFNRGDYDLHKDLENLGASTPENQKIKTEEDWNAQSAVPKKTDNGLCQSKITEKRIYEFLTRMLGEENANAALNRLWQNQFVKNDIGIRTPATFEIRVLLARKWLTKAMATPDFKEYWLRSYAEYFKKHSSPLADQRDLLTTDNQVLALINDLTSYIEEGDCYLYGPSGDYLDQLEDFRDPDN